jgi:hypothetical protein
MAERKGTRSKAEDAKQGSQGLSDVRPGGSPVAGIFTSDWHLWEKPPIARSVEEDWLKVQENYLLQLRSLQEKYGVPIFFAGDLFDRWNPSLAFVNRVISWLRGMDIRGIPGNHDIPNHNYAQLDRSAYWTLVEAGVIEHLTPGVPKLFGEVRIHSFPFGFEVKPLTSPHDILVEVALIHAMIWTKDTGWEGAPEDSRYKAWEPRLRGYEVAFFGDNHKPFHLKPPEKCQTVNCGSLLRRTMPEREHEPRVWLLRTDGSVESHFLDTEKDLYMTIELIEPLAKALNLDLSDFIEQLTAVEAERLDYKRAVVAWVDQAHDLSPQVRAVILRAIGEQPRR